MTNPDPGKHFKISSALKTLIGRDLITNPNVAVFELVKNAYDAAAPRVDVVFQKDRLVIVDNGSGMGPDDIRDKWLFVAYSGKKEAEGLDGRAYAGSKGVGRFAADQLGARLRLQTRAHAHAPIHEVDVDWERFEKSQDEHFVNIPVKRRTVQIFEVPPGITAPVTGTVLIVEGLRDTWPRQKLLKLRDYLTRLVDPFSETRAAFSIVITAVDEREGDRDEKTKAKEENRPPELVNGPVRSNLVEALREGTTSISVRLASDGETFDTTLTDRGAVVYKIREPNRFEHLETSDFDCQLFYLRRAAKASFSKRMGRSSVEYGSVFLFRNGFRVFPIGEEGNDFFGIDRRKQQGYARYLGTRDVIGRINVTGPDRNFRETTSRDGGLIETPALSEMREAFLRLAFRRLEAFVVDVTWPDKLDSDELEPGRMQTAEARERIVHLLAGLAETKEVQLLAVAPNLDSLLAERFNQQEPTMRALESIAKNQKDERLLRAVTAAKERFKRVVIERQQAESLAEVERTGRSAAEARLKVVSGALEEEKKRNLFLVSATPLDVQALQGFLHQIGLQGADVGGLADNALRALARPQTDRAELQQWLERISWRAQQIQAVTKFATRANFRMETDQVTEDLSQFLQEYIERVAVVWQDKISVVVASDGAVVRRGFRPIDMSIVVDNLISNARRAGAHEIRFEIAAGMGAKTKELQVWVSDNGKGLAPSIADPQEIFERGVTTTHGSGLGLWHVRHAMTESGGKVDALVDERRRLTFHLTFPS